MVEYRERLRVEAVKLCQDATLAEDLVFRTFEKVLSHAEGFQDGTNLFAWMKTIMTNLYRNDIKRPVVRGTTVADAAEIEQCAGVDWSTDEEILRNSDSEAIREAIQGLGPIYKEPLLKRYYDGLTLKEIAEIMRLPIGTVSRRLHVAHHLLAGKLSAKFGRLKKPLAVLVGALALVGAAFASWTTGFFGLLPEREPEASAEERQVGESVSTNDIYQTTKEENSMKMNKLAAVAALAAMSTTATAEYSDDYVSIDAGPVTAIDMGDDICYVFSNAVSSATLTTKSQMMLRSCLVVGGGGGGARQIGGGGGGGGVEIASGLNQSIESGTVFTLSVGAGGAASGGNGGHSSLMWNDTTLWGYGGGGGCTFYGSSPGIAVVANEIGSGGGAAYQAKAGTKGETYYQGNIGGLGFNLDNAGGGGGAGEAGNARGRGLGGEGVACDITGDSRVYGSGGGGGSQEAAWYSGGTNAGRGGCTVGQVHTAGEPGVDGFGCGGGGGDFNTGGGGGGCGTVILRFAKRDVSGFSFHLIPVKDQWHTGAAVCPSVTVVYDADGTTVAPEKYDLNWENNVDVGMARVAAVGKGDHLGASAYGTFMIKESWSDDNILTDDFSVRVVTQGDRFVYIFTNWTQTTTLCARRALTLVDSLVVGGGGAGGATMGGGGGGGGVIASNEERIVVPGGEIVLRVGDGGVPNDGWSSIWTVQGGKGGDSFYASGGTTNMAYGGAGGCGLNQVTLETGKFGSGGGGKSAYVDGLHYTSSQGNVGGGGAVFGQIAPGGGGGAGEPGHPCVRPAAGDGGEGVTNSITGVAEVYGSGGGGGAGNANSIAGRGGTHAGDGAGKDTGLAADSGDDGFGGGGGAGGYSPATKPGRGGSGIVVLAFAVGGSVAQPLISKIDVDFVNGTTQPKALVTLGCDDPNGKYSAAVRVQFGTSDGAWEFEGSVAEVKNGETAEVLAPFSPATGSTLWLRVTVTCEGAESVVETVDMPAEGIQSPCVGKGGGAGVIHVRPDATGRGDGSDWFNAMTDFRAAIERLGETHSEVWLSGDELMDYGLVRAINPGISAAIRGGFAGTECAPAERIADSRSTIDGNSKFACFTLQNAKPLTLDGFRLWGRKNNAILKTGAGDLVVTNCTIENCSTIGASIEGAAGSTIVRFEKTRFADLNAEATGCAINATKLSRLYLDACEVIRSGISLSDYLGAAKGYNKKGHALYFYNLPVTMRGCVVKGCRASSIENYTPDSGGVIRFDGSCGGSAMTNCAFVANEAVHGFETYDGPCQGDGMSGIVTVNMGDAASALDIVNCTFAYNVSETANAPAGLNVIKGTVNVKNAIFSGAKVRRAINAVSRDIWVGANGSVNVSYSIFDEAGSECVGGVEGAQINPGAGIVYGDPKLVSTLGEFADYLTSSASGFIGLNAAKSEDLCEWANVHLHSKTGYVDEKTGEKVNGVGGVRFACYSPAIDAGDPASIYSLEPKPNGKRVNLGFYGNTPWASMSQRSGFAVIMQ